LGSETILVLFDFDGVLGNTLPFIIKNAQEYATQMGIRVKVSEDDIKTLKKMEFEELGLKIGIPKARSKEFLKGMLELASKNEVDIFPGIVDVLDYLKNIGCVSCINTGNSRTTVKRFLERHGISGKISEIYDKENGDSKEEKINMALSRYGIEKCRCYMIGDAISDVEAAHRVGVKSIAATWGNQDFKLLKGSRPDFFASDPKDIISIINRNMNLTTAST